MMGPHQGHHAPRFLATHENSARRQAFRKLDVLKTLLQFNGSGHATIDSPLRRNATGGS